MSWGLTKAGRVKVFFRLLFLLIVAMILECQLRYPETIILFEGESLPTRGNSAYYLDAPTGSQGVLSEDGQLEEDSYNQYVRPNETGGYDMTLKLFGLIPVRSVTVDVQPQTTLAACGNTVGIKIFTQGLVCVGTQAIQESTGRLRDISREQDIRTGDIFLKADETELADTEQMGKIIQESDGRTIRFTLLREGQELVKELTPLNTQDGYKLGIWLRDSTAGIGTLTYYNPENLAFGALGHPIADSDTGTLMPVSQGTLLPATVFNIEKGEKGEPGELKGIFQTSEPDLGVITKNSEQGIFGTLDVPMSEENLYPVASRNQVREGKAFILSNISKNQVERFEIEIQKTMDYYGDGFKDMVIHVTDPDLIERTGGIVQGMSGSPIIQNGKLVGAVTHVFVNDPTRGYGIFIENMLAEAEKIK